MRFERSAVSPRIRSVFLRGPCVALHELMPRRRRFREPFVITLAMGAAACGSDDGPTCNGQPSNPGISCNPPFQPYPRYPGYPGYDSGTKKDAGAEANADAGPDGGARVLDGSPSR